MVHIAMLDFLVRCNTYTSCCLAFFIAIIKLKRCLVDFRDIGNWNNPSFQIEASEITDDLFFDFG
ncbi:hypothetical protein HanXRQr2_Chr15g0676871 [Helianthus annuus]|uniref:Uncharacterized protein n=1 Tax=Helianthus annuus TaxID=4232 RepID=A0A9K3DX33_HELAN|nr:hypothetical protein HanXRQr2_Chr15g0676871 [Helianthus annuus]